MEAVKALAQALRVVAPAAAAAVAPGLVAEAPEGVGQGGALALRAVWPAESGVAKAAPDLHRVPRLVVDIAAHLGKDALRQALPVVGAVGPAAVALAGHALKGAVAGALARVSVAGAAVGALHQRVGVVVLGQRLVGPGEATEVWMGEGEEGEGGLGEGRGEAS